MTFDDYQDNTAETAVYPGQSNAVGLLYCALKLNGEAGELAEHVGKAIRDDNLLIETFVDSFYEEDIAYKPDYLTSERKELIIKEIGDCLWYLARISAELNMNLSECAEINLEKLRKRKEAGTLQGSGDDR